MCWLTVNQLSLVRHQKIVPVYFQWARTGFDGSVALGIACPGRSDGRVINQVTTLNGNQSEIEGLIAEGNELLAQDELLRCIQDPDAVLAELDGNETAPCGELALA